MGFSPLCQEDFEEFLKGGCQCGDPNCENKKPLDYMVLSPNCHSGYPVFVDYVDRRLILRCSVCDAVVGEVFVAKRSENPLPDMIAPYNGVMQ